LLDHGTQHVAYAGFQYDFLAKRKQKITPYILNTRVYSCTLVNNSLPIRWRSIYNDDTDVCLQALKTGWCNVLFNAFLCCKAQTMTVKGGNTEQLYTIKDGRLLMAQALTELHPDVSRVSWKFGRWQHHVNYGPFRNNKLIKKEGLLIHDRINEYGMTIKTIENGQEAESSNQTEQRIDSIRDHAFSDDSADC
jgi:hypothetical protein